MSIGQPRGWIFSEEKPPIPHEGILHPKYARGLVKPWAYLQDMDRWYWFDEYASNWIGAFTPATENIPKDYLAQLLLIT